VLLKTRNEHLRFLPAIAASMELGIKKTVAGITGNLLDFPGFIGSTAATEPDAVVWIVNVTF